MLGKGKRSPSSSPSLTLHSTHLARRRSPFGMVRALEKASDGLSSSKWPPNQPMCMHHELSYVLEPLGLMLFACLIAPTVGGATNALAADLVERFERLDLL